MRKAVGRYICPFFLLDNGARSDLRLRGADTHGRGPEQVDPVGRSAGDATGLSGRRRHGCVGTVRVRASRVCFHCRVCVIRVACHFGVWI